MEIIIYTWGSNSDHILEINLRNLGHKVTLYENECRHYTRDLEFAQGLIELIHKSGAKAVVSNDFFPIISMICNVAGIFYYSWVYDSPHYTLLAKASKYSCNKIGCFDRAIVKYLNSIDIDTVFHLPLGVDWGDCECPETEEYRSDISFVGSLYTGKFNYYDSLGSDEYLKSEADRIVKKQCFDYEHDLTSAFFRENIKEDLLSRVRSILQREQLLPGNDYMEDIEYIFSSHFLEKQVTVEERRCLLTTVVGCGYDFALYTGSELTELPELAVVNRGIIDYHTQMPIVFKRSRINLNITLRSIKTGIPLRALDIMGCGGFLLSNYQKELEEYFEEGKEIVMFYSLDDCLEKIDYYLRNEEERSRIAAAGQKAVKERFSYRGQLEKLLNRL